MDKIQTAAGLVTPRAILRRINRRLRRDFANGADSWQALKVSRGNRTRQELGEFYLVDMHQNVIAETNVDPETLGHELGVLAASERVSDKEA